MCPYCKVVFHFDTLENLEWEERKGIKDLIFQKPKEKGTAINQKVLKSLQDILVSKTK